MGMWKFLSRRSTSFFSHASHQKTKLLHNTILRVPTTKVMAQVQRSCAKRLERILFFGSPPQRWWLKCKEVVWRGWKEYYSSGPHHKGDGSARHKKPLANKIDSCGIWTHAVYTSGTWVHPLRPLRQTVAACGADLKRSKLTSHFDICLQCRLKGLARSPRRRRKEVPEHFWQPWQWSSYSSQQGHVNKDAHNHSGPTQVRSADFTVIGRML